MSADPSIHEAASTSRPSTIPPGVLTVIGLVLLVYMITVESEPGALPLLLIVLGVAWYVVVVRVRRRSRPA